jgi:hypothetical protein
MYMSVLNCHVNFHKMLYYFNQNLDNIQYW